MMTRFVSATEQVRMIQEKLDVFRDSLAKQKKGTPLQ